MRVTTYAIGAVCALVVTLAASTASAQQLVVLRVSGDTNVRCSTLNQSTDPALAGLTSNFSFKINSPVSGKYNLTAASGELMGGAPADPDNNVTVTMGSDELGETFEWSSTLGIDAVIVKGGTESLVYVLDTKNGTGLHSPVSANNRYPDISHIEFCYDYEVDVTSTARTTFTRTHTWNIDQTVTSPIAMFTGDSKAATYDVAFTKTTTDSDWHVTGTIAVVNNTPLPATLTQMASTMGEDVDVLLAGCTMSSPLLPGARFTCDYSAALPNGGSRLNAAVVTTSGEVGGNVADVPVTFGDPTSVVGHDAVTIDHGDGTSETANRSGAYQYSRTVSCNADEGSSTRTAAIVEAGLLAPATLNVACYAVNVSATAETSFQRTYRWNIAKSAAAATKTLAIGESGAMDYSVTVDGTFADSGHAIAGTILVHNPAPIAATLTGVSGLLSGAAAVAVNCGTSFPYTLAAGTTLTCSYSAAVADASARTATATATLQNTPAGTTGFAGGANAAFGAPTTSVDRCATVTDAFNGSAATTLGEVCFSGTAATFAKTFQYAQQVGPYAASGTTTVTNTAFVTAPSGASRSSNASVTIDVPAPPAPESPNAGGVPPVDGVCTRTIGYWKTHDAQLAARLAAGLWLGTESGAKSELVTSAARAVSILSSSDSNGLNKLRAQLLATKLNIAGGAANTVADAMVAADAFLAAKGVNDWKNLSTAQKKQVDSWKTIFDSYNNGLLGVSHCQ